MIFFNIKPMEACPLFHTFFQENSRRLKMNRSSIKRAGLSVAFAMSGFFCANAYAGPNYSSGTITQHTTNANGMLIMISGALPTNCTGTPYG